MKLLMHTCCAPCSVYCIDTLRKEGIEPTLLWYNPNIHPYTEYVLRRDCLKEYSKKIGVNAIFEDEYGLEPFCKEVINDVKTRCIKYCYPIRLRHTFEYAKEHGYDTVTTTLLYSIYQKHDYIKHLMEKYAPGGYLKLWLPDSKNAERLKELQSIIADEVHLKSIFHRMFEEEKR